MKTAEDVAEDLMSNGVNRTILAQALTAFAEERVKEEKLASFIHGGIDVGLRVKDACYQQARAEALEEAAKVADSHTDDRTVDEIRLANRIADEIRALKEKP